MTVPLLGLICFLLITAAPLPASDIEGYVHTGSNAVTRATVQLLRERLPIEEHLITADGRFEFRNLILGSYSVRVRAEGFVEEEASVVLMRNTSREVVVIELRPLARAPDVQSRAVSVTEYQIPAAAKREFQQGYEERKRGRCAKAVPHFQKAIAVFDKYSDAFNELGHCLGETGNMGKAEESFKKAVEYSNTIYASISLTDLYQVQHRFSDAADVIRQAISKYPAEGDLYFAMARIHFDQGRLKEAAESGLEAHSRAHRGADVHILLAKIYLTLKDSPAVEAQLRLYLDENPKGPLADQVRRNLGTLGE